MNKFPFNQSIIERGRVVVALGCVHEIIFSEGTYQVEVVSENKEETFWPFLQLDDSGKVTDCFCTCKEAEKQGSCPHLAAAYLEIYKQSALPLHRRFRVSLWNNLMQMAAKRHGYDPSCLKKKKEEGYYAQSLNKKKLFSIEALSKKGSQKLEEIIHERVLETEETSLKFSNITAEELVLWKEGKPTHHLQYELSFWSDLAKWLMNLEEKGEKYQIVFHPAKGAIPKEVEVIFKEVKSRFYVAEVNWEELIPCLDRVNSPIPIYEYQDLVFDKIIYDKVNRVFHIQTHLLDSKEISLFSSTDDPKVIDLGQWLFHPDIGFYARHVDPFLRQEVIRQEGVAKMLLKYPRILEKYLVGTKIDTGFSPVFYDLYFDDQHRLHIAAYLFEKGELQRPTSAHFDGWVFLENKGFYQLGNLLFSETEKIIPKRLLSEFITKHKVWLNQYEGFQTHLTHIECYLTFGIDMWSRLFFKSTSGSFEDSAGILDLQDWVYIEGRGFYAKATTKIQQVLTPGLVIPKEDISSFIKSQEEDLETIHGFFNLKQPVEKLGLEVFLNKNKQIVIKPKVSLKKGYELDKVRFFGDYSYIEKEGFSLLPKGGRIPEIYEEETVIEEDDEEDFIINQLPLLKPLMLHLDLELKQPRHLHLKLHKLKQEDNKSKKQWFFGLSYISEHGEVSVKEIWEALKKKKRFLKTKAGLISLEETRFSWLRSIGKGHFSSDSELSLSSLEWIRLSLLENVELPSAEDEDREQSLLFLQEMKTLQVSEAFSLEGLQSHLRGYQETGVKWLWFLYSYGLSGLLCDEMGLGKTHQAMALLAACLNSEELLNKKFLVVCPTSVIYHWEDLLKRFLPDAKVFVFYGLQRSLHGFCEQGNILLTSYGTLRSEKEPLSEIQFEVAVFDELHVAKNAYSQTHKALRGIKARMKLGLTGTPIENRLIELHSLFDVILPSYLPDENGYKELFVVPIEKNQDQEKKKLLTKLIHPFTLRRKKEEVLQELPEKIEEVAYVDLSDEQRRLYKELCENSRKEILADIEDGGKPLPYMHIFALFNALKQVCDHPALVKKDVENYENYHSGKWELFVELLEEARESGQKVVVFSQYLKMLDIIEAYLVKNSIGYAQIRGSTKNRREEMRRFKEESSCEIFIGSLQAAGVGIDLVSASVVIHYDRWWNPAKENQATDRVHRMGQNRGVQVFKLVSKDTIEEHIHQIIEKKLILLKEIVSYDDQDQVKHLDRDELISLLKKIDTYF